LAGGPFEGGAPRLLPVSGIRKQSRSSIKDSSFAISERIAYFEDFGFFRVSPVSTTLFFHVIDILMFVRVISYVKREKAKREREKGAENKVITVDKERRTALLRIESNLSPLLLNGGNLAHGVVPT
jgi:hypothetical protein